MAQINTRVGDFEGNTSRILDIVKTACAEHANPLVIFPELTLIGYPPEDLLLRPSIGDIVESHLTRLCTELPSDAWVFIGYPRSEEHGLYNAMGVLHDGKIVAEYFKQELPNYQVFDEKRYFKPGIKQACVFPIENVPVGLTICEDIWDPNPSAQAALLGAKLLININSSPFHIGKQGERYDLVRKRAKDLDLSIIYVNQVGAQDELVFDGGSFAVDDGGEITAAAENFEEELTWIKVDNSPSKLCFMSSELPKPVSELESIWKALVLGLRDYVEKNGFPGVILGLSGGVDSALTLALAVDALGATRVQAVMMPFRYTSKISIEDAKEQSENLSVKLKIISIEAVYKAFMGSLSEEFSNLATDTTEENLQARCRGVILMSISNKKGLLVLTTGNKTEIAVGYSTLYGDMAGGFDVLKDVPKMLVYELCKYRNRISECIPARVLDRPPSAELAPDQRDQDSLPPYPILDRILELYIEKDQSLDDIVSQGYASEYVEKAIRLVDQNEYKRRQSPIGVRISKKGFGRDRRYPITSSWTT